MPLNLFSVFICTGSLSEEALGVASNDSNKWESWKIRVKESVRERMRNPQVFMSFWFSVKFVTPWTEGKVESDVLSESGVEYKLLKGNWLSWYSALICPLSLSVAHQETVWECMWEHFYNDFTKSHYGMILSCEAMIEIVEVAESWIFDFKFFSISFFLSSEHIEPELQGVLRGPPSAVLIGPPGLCCVLHSEILQIGG